MSSDDISFFGSVSPDGVFGSFYIPGKNRLIDIYSVINSMTKEEQEGLILRIRNNIQRMESLERLYQK